MKSFAVERNSIVLHSRPFIDTHTLVCTHPNTDWEYRINSDILVPKEVFNFNAAGKVYIKKLTLDLENKKLIDLDEIIITDKLRAIRVRGFALLDVYKENTSARRAVTMVDLEY